ncbi:hypothetical protein O181_004958 [Austropuccinia psidii MF-1]|uniref:Retrotransposon gag domain-containing protein n=1 Tax=Austropuccinia psidii MF-1 TaxID=1389203 RepID=A0A9Q3BHD4_9BASI|nr:hypothetical protein [Austropuccinia psidii MF-1]
MEGETPSRKEGRGKRRSSSFLGVVGAFPGISRTTFKGPGTSGPALAQSNQPVSHPSESSLLAILQYMAQIIANIQPASPFEASRPPDFFNQTQPFKVRTFIQSCQIIFHNYQKDFSDNRKEILYSISFLICRTAKWIEPYLYKLINKDLAYLCNNWALFETQLYTLFIDPNEVRKAEAELNSLRMEEGGHVSLYIAYFRIIISKIGDWGERALIHHFRKGLTSHPSRIVSLQDLMDITLSLDTSYNERQKEKNHFQKKKLGVSKFFKVKSKEEEKNLYFQKKDKPHSSFLNEELKLMGSEN